MAKLDAYTRTVYSKKLFQLHLTYDVLQAIFENSCSFMDFYEALQDRGIDRKTAKHFACQFGGMGLRNQGTEPYCDLPKSAVTGGEELDYSVNMDLLSTKGDTERPPNVPPLPNVDESATFDSVENWESELDESRSFTFPIPKPVLQFSLTIDDFVSNSPSTKSTTPQQNKKNSIAAKKISKTEAPRTIKSIGRKFDDNECSEPKDKASTAKSGTKAKFSRKKPDPNDVFRNGTSSLQLGKFYDKSERYKLERELLGKITKDYEDNNSEKDEEILKAESASPRNLEIPRNAENLNKKSEKSVEKTRKKTINEHDAAALQVDKKIAKGVKAIRRGSNDETETVVLSEDKQSNKCTAALQEVNIKKQKTRIPLKKRKDMKEKGKLRRGKSNLDPVVFLCRKSIEKKQKHWQTVEIFVGDFSICVPVDPNLTSTPASSPENVVQESSDDKLHVSFEEKDVCDVCEELDTQPADHFKSEEEMKSDKTHVIIDENSNENSNEDEIKLSHESCDGKIKTTDEEKNTSEIVADLVSEESNVASLEYTQLTSETSSIDQKAHTNKIKMIDSSQQTNFDWYENQRKKRVDQEQQTDCALLSTFNIETSLTQVKMRDKETLTDHSVSRRAQSTDTISSYGDNLSDYYGTSPSSPVCESQYTEMFNLEQESPAGVFDISISPHNEDTNGEKGIQYEEIDSRYSEEDAQYPKYRYQEEVNRYEIPSPEENYQYEAFYFNHKQQQIPRSDVYQQVPNNPSNLNPQGFPVPQCPLPPPPIYAVNPNNVTPPPLFHPRFHQQYFQRLPRNSSNGLQHGYHGPSKF